MILNDPLSRSLKADRRNRTKNENLQDFYFSRFTLFLHFFSLIIYADGKIKSKHEERKKIYRIAAR